MKKMQPLASQWPALQSNIASLLGPNAPALTEEEKADFKSRLKEKDMLSSDPDTARAFVEVGKRYIDEVVTPFINDVTAARKKATVADEVETTLSS